MAVTILGPPVAFPRGQVVQCKLLQKCCKFPGSISHVNITLVFNVFNFLILIFDLIWLHLLCNNCFPTCDDVIFLLGLHCFYTTTIHVPLDSTPLLCSEPFLLQCFCADSRPCPKQKLRSCLGSYSFLVPELPYFIVCVFLLATYTFLKHYCPEEMNSSSHRKDEGDLHSSYDP